MIEIQNNKDCCGCRSCEQICHTKAITFYQDKEGFNYPEINKLACTNCGLCNKVCPIENEFVNIESFDIPVAYAAWNLDDEERKKASSGGCFAAIAKHIFSLNGIVCGAGFDESLNVIHKFAFNNEELEEFKGSKYTQSDPLKTFNDTKKYLDAGKNVLYSGTPCQISGLRSFLRIEYPNLYTVDLICHGVPSPKVYKKYLKESESKEKIKIKKIYFRDKSFGWKAYSLRLDFDNEKKYIGKSTDDAYIQGFLKNVYLRPSCYYCKFSKLPRYSDVTLGDFWGVENKYPEFDDDKGTSLILINTKMGLRLLESCKEMIFFKEVDLNYALKNNQAAVSSVKPNKNRKKFFSQLDQNTFEKLSHKYFLKTNFLKKLIIILTESISKTIKSSKR